MASDNAMYNKISLPNRGYETTTSYERQLAPTDGSYGAQRSRGQVLGAKEAPTGSGGGGSSKGASSASTAAIGGYDGGFDAMAYMEALRAQQRADAEAAYARARNALNDAYSSASDAYGNIYNSGADQLGRSYDNSRGKINSEATDAFRQAYVNRMLSEKNLGQRMAAMGMSGGASESTMAGLLNNYGNARNGIQRTLDTNLGDLEMKYQGNLADLYNAYQQNMANIAAQRASQLSNLEMQLANLNANMGGDYYSAMMSNIGNLQKMANNAVANQAAYVAPETAQATNTFTPANVQQANDVGSRATNYARLQLEEELARLRANGTTDPGILTKTMLNKGYSIDDLYGYI
jgi:hypothetical protein